MGVTPAACGHLFFTLFLWLLLFFPFLRVAHATDTEYVWHEKVFFLCFFFGLFFSLCDVNEDGRVTEQVSIPYSVCTQYAASATTTHPARSRISHCLIQGTE